jgi:hypothetical protein
MRILSSEMASLLRMNMNIMSSVDVTGMWDHWETYPVYLLRLVCVSL